jgi:hypothetical protein
MDTETDLNLRFSVNGDVVVGITDQGIRYEKSETQEVLPNNGYEVTTSTKYSDGHISKEKYVRRNDEQGNPIENIVSVEDSNSQDVVTFFKFERTSFIDNTRITTEVIRDDEGNLKEYTYKGFVSGSRVLTSHHIEYGDDNKRLREVIVKSNNHTISTFNDNGELLRREIVRVKGNQEITAIYGSDGKIIEHKKTFLR